MIPIDAGFVRCGDCTLATDAAQLCRSCAARLARYRRVLAERYATVDRPDPTADERRADARSALDTSW